jgi:hypothetical protein
MRCCASGTLLVLPAQHVPLPHHLPSAVAVSGSGFRVASFGFRVPGSEFRVPGSGFRVSNFGSRVAVFGFRVSVFGFRVFGYRFRVLTFGFRFSGFGFRVSGSEVRWGNWRDASSPPPPLGRGASRQGNTLNGCQGFSTENGSSRGQNLALTRFLVGSTAEVKTLARNPPTSGARLAEG